MGFTLIELLISCAIISIITALVLVKYSGFDSTVLLKSAAYEMALGIREAQVKSVSVMRGSSGFDSMYGVFFSQAKEYGYLRINGGVAESLGSTTLPRSMQISDVCVDRGAGYTCGITSFGISFRRPEFKAIYIASVPTSTIQRAKIRLNSTRDPSKVFYVEVTQFGQISVLKE
jgi:prepilin-type N-terminal cleavage/methylation domain-containing protein